MSVIKEESVNAEEEISRSESLHKPFLYLGQTFNTLPELREALSNYERTNYVNLSVRAANKIRRQSKHFILPDAEWTKRLVYCHLKYSCNRGGSNRSSTSKGIRPNVKSLLQGCPMFVKLGLTRDKQKLVVKKMNLTHNHSLDQETYQNFPRQRGLTEQEKLAVIELVEEFKLDKRLVLKKLRKETGKHITMKSIHNIIYIHRRRNNGDKEAVKGGELNGNQAEIGVRDAEEKMLDSDSSEEELEPVNMDKESGTLESRKNNNSHLRQEDCLETIARHGSDSISPDIHSREINSTSILPDPSLVSTPHNLCNRFSQAHPYFHQFSHCDRKIPSDSTKFPLLPKTGSDVATVNQAEKLNKYCWHIFQSLCRLTENQQTWAVRRIEEILDRAKQEACEADTAL